MVESILSVFFFFTEVSILLLKDRMWFFFPPPLLAARAHGGAARYGIWGVSLHTLQCHVCSKPSACSQRQQPCRRLMHSAAAAAAAVVAAAYKVCSVSCFLAALLWFLTQKISMNSSWRAPPWSKPWTLALDAWDHFMILFFVFFPFPSFSSRSSSDSSSNLMCWKDLRDVT